MGLPGKVNKVYRLCVHFVGFWVYTFRFWKEGYDVEAKICNCGPLLIRHSHQFAAWVPKTIWIQMPGTFSWSSWFLKFQGVPWSLQFDWEYSLIQFTKFGHPFSSTRSLLTSTVQFLHWAAHSTRVHSRPISEAYCSAASLRYLSAFTL